MAGALGSLSTAESAWSAPIAFVACGWFGVIAQTVCNLQSDKSHTSWVETRWKLIVGLLWWHSRQLSRDCMICSTAYRDPSTCNILCQECAMLLTLFAPTAHAGRQQYAYVVMSNSTHVSSLTPAAVVPNRILAHAGAVSVVITTGQNQ